jgi:hypothetical protein
MTLFSNGEIALLVTIAFAGGFIIGYACGRGDS